MASLSCSFVKVIDVYFFALGFGALASPTAVRRGANTRRQTRWAWSIVQVGGGHLPPSFALRST